MQNNKPFKRILWAINPFDQAPDVQKNVRHWLTELAYATNASIEPVHVANFPSSFSQRMYSKTDFQALIQEGLDAQLQKMKIPHLLPARIILDEEASVSHSVRLLNGYASRTSADLIVVATHGRKGTARFFLGSFAETLLYRSELPILTICPKTDPPRPLKHILFATDFEESSLRAYKKVLALALQIEAKLTVVNVFHPGKAFLIPYGAYGAGDISGAWMPAPEDVEEIHQSKVIDLQDWAELGRKKGVNTHSTVISSDGNTAEDIMYHADRHRVDLIAMAAYGGTVRSTVFGSVTRQVVRSASCPVWVMHA